VLVEKRNASVDDLTTCCENLISDRRNLLDKTMMLAIEWESLHTQRVILQDSSGSFIEEVKKIYEALRAETLDEAKIKSLEEACRSLEILSNEIIPKPNGKVEQA
jgi:hypothetical protein